MEKVKFRFLKVLLTGMVAMSFILAGCAASDDDDGGGSSNAGFNMAGNASEALPAISSSSNSPALQAVGDDVTDTEISNFFKLECHMPGSDDNCPAGITADDDTKYSVTTLIGVIYHAEMYMENVIDYEMEDCSTTGVTSSSFVTDDATGDTSTYLIDYYDLLDCVGSSSYEGNTQYFTARTSTDSGYVILVTRKHDTSTSGWDQSDIYQAYVSTDSDGEARFLAFNTTNINDTSSTDSTFRTVLLVNLSTRRFLVKHHGTGSNYVIAAGQGGITDSGEYQSGYYFAKSSGTPSGICVDNATQTEAASSNCSDEQASWSGASDVASYLDLTATEQTEIENFISYFTSGPTASGLSVYPSSANDAGHIPDRIQ